MNSIQKTSAMVGLVLLVAGAGWTASKTFATTDQVRLAETKADYALDMLIQSLRDQLARLKAKPNKDLDDYGQISYLRAEIERLRKVRRGQR